MNALSSAQIKAVIASVYLVLHLLNKLKGIGNMAGKLMS